MSLSSCFCSAAAYAGNAHLGPSCTIKKEGCRMFEQIDRAALKLISEKGKAAGNIVGTVRCKTVAEGKRFRHLNYIRDLDQYIVDEPKGALGDDTAPNPVEVVLAALGSCLAVGRYARLRLNSREIVLPAGCGALAIFHPSRWASMRCASRFMWRPMAPLRLSSTNWWRIPRNGRPWSIRCKTPCPSRCRGFNFRLGSAPGRAFL